MKKTRTFLSVSLLIISTAAFAQRDTIKVREVGLVFSSLSNFGLCYKFGNEHTLFRVTALSLTGTNTSTSYSQFSEGDTNDAVPSSTTKSFGVGLNFGFEKRRKINERSYFYYGLVLINSYSQSKTNTNTPVTYTIGYFDHGVYMAQAAVVNNTSQTNTWTLSSGLGIVIGVAYKLTSSFSIGAELIPSTTYSYSETKNTASTYNIAWTGSPNAPYTLDAAAVNASSDKVTKGISFSVINTSAAITIAYRIK